VLKWKKKRAQGGIGNVIREGRWGVSESLGGEAKFKKKSGKNPFGRKKLLLSS